MDTNKLWIEMCSTLTPLQEGHEWKWGDTSQDDIFVEWVEAKNKFSRLWHGASGRYEIEDDTVYCPIFERMIEIMPEETEWSIEYAEWKTGFHYFVDVDGHVIDTRYKDDLQCLFLQALAWARWGWEWDNEKGEWRDANK